MNDILLKLEQLGFSSYEAKAYYALIRKHPANGYEIGKIGKIPSAKIYEILNRLKLKGAIVESSAEVGKFYPVPPETLLSKLKQEYTSLIEELGSRLEQTEPLPDFDLSFNFSGYEIFIEKSTSVIHNANNSLLVSIWPEERVLLNDAIATAKQRGVTVVAGVFGDIIPDHSYYVNLESCGLSSRARLSSRLNVVIGDSREVVICEIGENGEAEGVWTTTPGIVLVAKEYVKHDIWGNVMIEKLGRSEFERLCGESPMLSYLIKYR